MGGRERHRSMYTLEKKSSLRGKESWNESRGSSVVVQGETKGERQRGSKNIRCKIREK